MEMQLEIRKLEAKNTLPKYHKIRLDSKLHENSVINVKQPEQGIVYYFNQSE